MRRNDITHKIKRLPPGLNCSFIQRIDNIIVSKYLNTPDAYLIKYFTKKRDSCIKSIDIVNLFMETQLLNNQGLFFAYRDDTIQEV